MNKTFSKPGLVTHLNRSTDHHALANELVSTGVKVEIKQVLLESGSVQMTENRTTFSRLRA
jgi:hypothetical protein